MLLCLALEVMFLDEPVASMTEFETKPPSFTIYLLRLSKAKLPRFWGVMELVKPS